MLRPAAELLRVIALDGRSPADSGAKRAGKTACARFALTSLLAVALSGCGTLYLAQAARGQWQVMRERQPIEQVLADESTPAALRARLLEVRDAREFASSELSLPDNSSYRSYADVRRPFVVWNVVAAPEFSVEPRKWCFPIVGCVAYRGYFTESSARAFAAKLQKQGFDVTVGGIPAYSTLGRTADPVLNTMLRYGDTEVAAIVFHELAHQVVYVAGDTSFNEAFAVTVEEAGLERWLKKRGRESELQRYLQQKQRLQEYIDLLMRYRARLHRTYARKADVHSLRTRKQAVLDELASDLRSLEQRQGAPSPYAQWLKEGLNNAQLASVATYFDCVPGFEKLLEDSGGEMRVFFASVRRIAGQPRAERHSQLCAGPVRAKN